MKYILSVLITFLVLSTYGQTIIFVDQSATGANNGTSWTDAYTDLQNAFQATGNQDIEIWVAKGIYKPAQTNRNQSFEIKSGVTLRGGFEGTENNLSERSLDSLDLFETNHTVLSGNLGNVNVATDNSKHVVTFSPSGNNPIILEGFTITGGYSLSGKGAGINILLRSGVKDTIKNCRIVDNVAYRGGGVYFEGSDLMFNTCSFEDNRATNAGGGFRSNSGTAAFFNCIFFNNVGDDQGGAGNASFGSVSFSQTVFLQNRSILGGALSYFLADFVYTDCRFEKNYASSEGGALYTEGISTTSIKGGSFIENSAGIKGGGIFMEDSSADMDSVQFKNNKADTTNTLRGEGGALCMYSGIQNISASTFSKNSSADGGGAILNFGNTLLISECQFNDNSAQRGGAIFNSSFSESTVRNSDFIGNWTTTSDGGGVYNYPRSISEFDNCHFEGNFSASDGGGMINWDSEMQAKNCTFIDNRSQGVGGAIWITDANPIISFCTFQRDTALAGAIGRGGAIYISSTSHPQISNSSFSENYSDIGGAINIWGASASFHNNTFAYNSALTRGGAFYIRSAQNVEIKSSTIYQNVAKINGSGIYTSISKIALKSNILGDNRLEDLTIQDIYNETIFNPSSDIISEGYNFISDSSGANMSLKRSDIFGDLQNPISPMLDTLGYYGGPYLILPPLPGSLVLGAGETLDSTDIISDQRGFSRKIGSRENRIDLGAFESQSTFITPIFRPICSDEPNLLPLQPILIQDSTGGAFAEGENLSLEFSAPPGIRFQAGQGNITCSGNGLSGCSILVTSDFITVNYSRSYDTSLNTIELSKLFIELDNSSSVGDFEIIRSGGSAIQYDNQIEDSVELASLQVIPTYKLVDLPYDDSFESNQELWTPAGEKSIWELGEPVGEIIQGASSGQSAWMTDLDDAYPALDSSIILSPCFDFRGILSPILGVNVWSDTEEGFDGTVLQQSSDYGNSWNTIGTTERGLNWYNSSTIISNPGNSNTSAQFGWTGRDTTWKRARLRLTNLQDQRAVRFRFAFASIPQIDPTQSNNGFAFDDFFIGEEGRTILLEHFSDETQSGNNDKVKALAASFNRNVVPIQYHISEGDEFYEKNKAGPRTRALYYGISEPGMVAVNGRDYLDATGNLSEGPIERSLFSESSMLINLDTTSSESIEIISSREIEDEVIVYAAIVENTSDQSFVFRKFLPDAAGISIPYWTSGEREVFDLSWDIEANPAPDIIDNYDSLWVVVFVQNRESKEIYQTVSEKIWSGILDRDALKEGLFPTPEARLQVYPNPTKNRFFIDFGVINERPFSLKMTNMQGKIVRFEEMGMNQTQYKVDMSGLASGMYFLELDAGETHLLREKIILRD